MAPALIQDVSFLLKLNMQIQKTCLDVTVKEGSKKYSFDVFLWDTFLSNLVPI